MKISESIVYITSQLIFLGNRQIAQEGGEILPNIAKTLGQFLGKFYEFKILPKPQCSLTVSLI